MSEHPGRTGVNRPEETASRAEAARGLITGIGDSGVSKARIITLSLIVLVALGYLVYGLVIRQLREAGEYDTRFRIQSTRLIRMPAPRGYIFDRNGVLLVKNRARYNIVADLSVLRDEFWEQYLKDIRMNRPKNPEHRAAAIRAARVTVLQRYLDRVNRLLKRSEHLDAEALAKHMTRNRTLDFPLVHDIEAAEMAKFCESFPVEFPLRIYVDSVRTYAHGDSAAHVLGYLGNSDNLSVPGDDEDDDPLLKKIRAQNYVGKKGKSGLELSCDNTLRGRAGSQEWMVKPTGYLFQKLFEKPAEQGSHIYCSLDIRLQEAAERALAETSRGGQTGQLKGCAIALDIGTGEILALATYPRFDPNKFADNVSRDYMNELHETGGELNLATQGVYSPGSTFKVILAIAGMRSGRLDPEEILQCPSTFSIGGIVKKEHDGIAFGEVNLETMLKVSCNVYCWQMGLRVGIDDFSAEARRLGIENKIELEIETAPRSSLLVGTPKWKRDNGYSGWSAGDTLNSVIGQGYVSTTPLHMAAMIASVAANRTHTKLTLLHDPSNNGRNLPMPGEPLGLTPYQRERMTAGLRACVQDGGTGKKVNIPGLDIVGKTGTAEAKDRGRDINLAWFEGFAPANNPRIAVVTMLVGEHGMGIHGGSEAGPIARAIFQEWLKSHPESANAPAEN